MSNAAGEEGMSKLARRVRIAIVVGFISVAGVASSTGTTPGVSHGVLGIQTSTIQGGATLDAYGGIHVFGGATLNTAGAPYWGGWDIARGIAALPDGSGGYVLDGYGGVHAFGAAHAALGGPYWGGWDIARAIAVTPNGTGGYVLDGYGGVHPWGTAPWLNGQPYWPGWDIARGLDIHYNNSGNPDGGWELDGYGGIHAFGAAPPIGSPHYYPGFDIFRNLHVLNGGAYEVTHWGDVETVNSPPSIDYSGAPDWGSWDIVRDLIPLDSNSQSATPQSMSSAPGLMAAVHNMDREQRGLAPLYENGNLESIAGGGDQYNTAWCGGPNQIIDNRTRDMVGRDYFAHAIQGCPGTQYVFSTYMAADHTPYRQAGENIAWRAGDTSLLDNVWEVNAMWLASPGHYANMMGPYSQIGCGLYNNPSQSYQGYTGAIWVWACEFTG